MEAAGVAVAADREEGAPSEAGAEGDPGVPVDAAAEEEEREVADRRGENIDGLSATWIGIKIVIKEISNFISFNNCNSCCSRIYTAQKPMTDRLRLRYDRPQGKASREALT